MKYLVIYNTQTGEIVMRSTVRDASEPLSGGLLVEVPDGKVLKAIDVTDPTNPEPIFEDAPYAPDLDAMEAQLYYTAVMTGTLIEEEE